MGSLQIDFICPQTSIQRNLLNGQVNDVGTAAAFDGGFIDIQVYGFGRLIGVGDLDTTGYFGVDCVNIIAGIALVVEEKLVVGIRQFAFDGELA